jgi:hypothetical protein
MVKAGADVLHYVIGTDARHQADAMRDARLIVFELDIPLDAIEQCWSHHKEALFRVAVGDAANVLIDAEHLLHKHDAAAAAGIAGDICRELMAIGGFEPCEM